MNRSDAIGLIHVTERYAAPNPHTPTLDEQASTNCDLDHLRFWIRQIARVADGREGRTVEVGDGEDPGSLILSFSSRSGHLEQQLVLECRISAAALEVRTTIEGDLRTCAPT